MPKWGQIHFHSSVPSIFGSSDAFLVSATSFQPGGVLGHFRQLNYVEANLGYAISPETEDLGGAIG